MSYDDINLWEVLDRKRFALSPFYVGAASAVAGGLSAGLDTPQAGVALAAIGISSAYWIKSRVRDSMRRAYAYAVLGTSTAWVMAAHEFWEYEPGWLSVGLVAGTLVGGIPWWASTRRRMQVRMEESIRDWPTLAGRIGLGSTRLVGITVSGSGYRGRIVWPPGEHEVDNIMNRAAGIEGVLSAPRGAVRLEYDGEQSNAVKFSVVLKDPHAEPQPWPEPGQVRRAEDPMAIGIREDGSRATLRRYVKGRGARSLLIGGQTDSGKSSLINLDIAESAVSSDVCQIGFDFKHVEMTPWAPVMTYMTTSVEKARALVRAIAAPDGLLDERGKILGEKGRRWWDTAIDGPMISIPVDEARDLLGGADSKTLDAFSQIATKGRALAIRFVLATQFPTLESIGTSQIREQILQRACFRMQDERGEHFVFPGHRVRAEKIPTSRPGTCYLGEGSDVDRAPTRVYYLNDEQVKVIVAARTGMTPELDERSEAALVRHFPEFADRPRYEVVPVTGTPAGLDRHSGGTDRDSSGTDRDSTGTLAGLDRHSGGTAGTSGGTAPGLDRQSAADDRHSSGTPAGLDRDSVAGDRDSTGTLAGLDRHSGGTRPALGGTDDIDMAALLRDRRDSMSAAERHKRDSERDSALAEGNSERDSNEDARDIVARMVAESGTAGLRATDLYRAAGRSSSWFYSWVAEEGARFVRNAEGRWILRENQDSSHSV